MPIVRNFVNHASSQGLKSYFSANDGFDQVDWSKEQPEVASKVIVRIPLKMITAAN